MMATSVLVLASLLAQAQDYLSQGLKALDANQPAAAEPFLRKAVEADPNDLQASFNFALVLGMEGKDTEAVAAWRRTLELKPGLFEANLNLGILLVRGRQPADAVPVLHDAVAAKPSEFRPLFFYAQALYDSGDFAEAEKNFQASLALDAKSAGANLGMARSLLKQGKLPDSAPFFRAAASLDPSYKNALLELGIEYDRNGQSGEAIAIFKEFPSNQAVTKRMTELLVATDQAAAAIPALETAVANAATTKNRMALIDAYRQANQRGKMMEQLQLAVEGDPSNFDLRMSYGRNLRDDHKFPAAAREFQAAAGLKPDSVAALNELAGVLIMAERYDDGLAALDRVRALGKEIPGDLYLRAITLDKLHRNKPALEAYREFLAAASGKYPDDEFRARQRARLLERELGK